MSQVSGTLRRVAGIGLGWAALWVMTWIAVGTIIGIVDPDSIDPGESPLIMGPVIFGPMSFLSGIACGLLLSIGRPGPANLTVSLARAAAARKWSRRRESQRPSA